MTRTAGHNGRVEELRTLYAERKERIRCRLADFSSVKPEDYFYELAYCLLTPQSSALHAARAIDTLQKADFLGGEIEPVGILRQDGAYIRFHITKAQRLKELKQTFPEIRTKLADGMDGRHLRTWLVRNVNGLGWKEASHFLRNIGYRDLAILDRHILRNLRRLRVIRSLPRSLTPARYLAIEEKFARFAGEIGIPMDDLDLLFWSRETGEILK